jgi:hypothetical protein
MLLSFCVGSTPQLRSLLRLATGSSGAAIVAILPHEFQHAVYAPFDAKSQSPSLLRQSHA